MNRFAMLAAIVGFASSFGAGPVGAASEEDPSQDQALTDLVMILRNEGIIDEGQFNQLSAKAARREAKESWTDRFSMWGDLRGRWEGFYYDRDDDDVPNRSRFRYRLRLNGKAKINPYAELLFRLASGADDDRSTNRTLGDLPDFASDPIRIDRAYLRLTPFAEGRFPDENGTLFVEFGKTPNPYYGKKGKDYLLWDNDINFEGASLLLDRNVTDDIALYFNTGFYMVREYKEKSDPSLFAAQFGADIDITEEIEFGARATYFRFGNIDEAMLERGASGFNGVTSSGGNIMDGMTRSEHVDIVETRLYLQYNHWEDWPLLAYGTVSGNLSARPPRTFSNVGKNALGWGVGVTAGNKKKWALFGVSYYEIQANAQFSQFTDSDLFDGRTNHKGFSFYGAKEILKNTEFALTAFWSRPIRTSLPAFGGSVPKANRVRIMADLKVKF